MRLLRARAALVAVTLGAGVLLGLVGPVAGKWDNPACVAISTCFSGGWPWACYAFLVGYSRRSRVESALLAALGLTVGVVAYYLCKDASPVFSSQILVWGTAAFVLGAPVGLLGNLARISGPVGLGFRLTIPLVAFCETSVRLSAESGAGGATAVMTWNVVRFLAVAVALALVGRTIWRRT